MDLVIRANGAVIDGEIRSAAVAVADGVIRAVGPIDADYPDEWLAMLKNDSGSVVFIEHGERVAQVVLNRFEVLEWREGSVGVSTDRVGGVGSTGSG